MKSLKEIMVSMYCGVPNKQIFVKICRSDLIQISLTNTEVDILVKFNVHNNNCLWYSTQTVTQGLWQKLLQSLNLAQLAQEPIHNPDRTCRVNPGILKPPTLFLLHSNDLLTYRTLFTVLQLIALLYPHFRQLLRSVQDQHTKKFTNLLNKYPSPKSCDSEYGSRSSSSSSRNKQCQRSIYA